MDCIKVTTIAILLFIFVHGIDAGNCSVPKDCESCLKYNESTCFWCESSGGKCMKKDGLLPKGCSSLQWKYYGNCTVPGWVWVIVIPVLCVVFLISLLCCFYCCCCRGKRSSKSINKEEAKFHKKRMELKAKHEERRSERKRRTDQIRQKYGLYKEDGGTASSRYEQFDNDPEI